MMTENQGITQTNDGVSLLRYTSKTIRDIIVEICGLRPLSRKLLNTITNISES